jgi:PPOX class probable F420-dependent enzyme
MMTTQDSGVDTRRAAIEAFLSEPRNIMVGAVRRDGRPQITPNWYYWDGNRFYISTTRSRQKYRNFKRDPRVQLVLDEPTSFKTVLIDGAVDIWEDLERGLPYFKRIREKHGHPAADDGAMLAGLRREGRVLLVITPERPLEQWTTWGIG